MNTILLERWLGALYVLIGPAAWGLFAFGMIKGRQRLSLLKRPIQPLPNPPPSATVLVPIKDEADKIRQCLASIIKLDYPNLQIIAIDDRSTDATPAILDEIARAEPRLEVIHIRAGDLPPAWVGKSHALHVGMRQARGDWLLFVDSDVELSPDVLAATIALAEQKEFDLISLLPRLINRTFWERLIVPLGGAATSAMYLLPVSNYNDVPSIAFANGQFMCVRRSAYEKIGGHEAVRETLSEDIAIARAMKRSGLRPRLSIGSDFASTRMYDSLPATMRGWSRNFFCGSAGRPGKMIGAILFIFFCCFSCYAAFAWGVYRWFNPIEPLNATGWMIAGAVHWLILTIALAVSYRWTGNPRRYALLFPLGAAMMIAIWLRTLRMCATGRIEWRGTAYTHRAGHGLIAS